MSKKLKCTSGDGSKLSVSQDHLEGKMISIEDNLSGKTAVIFLSPKDAKKLSKLLKKQLNYAE